MSKFITGFLAASFIWAATTVAYLKGYVEFDLIQRIAGERYQETSNPTTDKSDESKKAKRVRRKWKPAKRRKRRPYGTALTGDSLNEDQIRDIDMVGHTGEQQLTDYEVEQGIDSVFGKIRRCLLLIAEEDPITGKVTFGMRITGKGRVSRVNLNGPSPIVRGEAGACLRRTLKSIQYRSFDGPDMVVHYPIDLN